MSQIHVTKYSGDKEIYDEAKLRRSLLNAGAKPDTVERITQTIAGSLYDGISTQKIYSDAFHQLHSESDPSAGRYKLKEALFELGPTGYPFEKFIGKILQEEGYETETGVIMPGDCVSHEVDVVAHNNDEYLMVECKFHNRTHHHCSVKVPLYIHSRFLDIKGRWSGQPGHTQNTHRGCVATNTRFTSDAIQYATCVGLRVLSWDYPHNKGISDLVKKHRLHPITCLSSLDKEEKQRLLENGTILCRDICHDDSVLASAGIDHRHMNKIVKEAERICNHNH